MGELAPNAAAFLKVAVPARPWWSLTPAEARAQHLASRRPDDGAPDVTTREVSVARPDGSSLALRVYEAAPDAPVLVFFHGGGWVYGDLDMADGFCRRLCVGAKVTVCSVDYRLSPEHRFPLPLDDACLAVAWTHSELAGGRPVGVIGSSAGGNLAVASCVVDRDDGTGRIGLQIPLCAVMDHGFDNASYRDNADGYFLTAEDMRWYWAQYLADPAHGSNPRASVLRADLAGLPPALVITAEFDPLRDEEESYARLLSRAGVPSTLVRYDGMIHAFAALSAFPVEQARVIDDVSAAVDQFLR